MTYEQAISRAVQLHNDETSYDDIAAQLKKAGYVSPKTGAPVGPQAVRAMIRRHGTQPKTSRRRASQPSLSDNLLADLEAILATETLTPERRLSLIRRLVNDTPPSQNIQ